MPKITEAQIERTREYLNRGGSIRSAARGLGVDESSLRRRLHGGRKSTGTSYRTLAVEPEREEIPVFFSDFSHLAKLHLYPLGDVHKGSPAHQRARWREWLAYLTATKHAAMLCTGDLFNAALKDSKSDVYEEQMTVGDARRELREELRPLAEGGRLIGMVDGNHEDRVTRGTGDSPGAVLAEMLEVPYAEASGLWVVTVGDQTYEIYMRHGTGNGQSLVALSKGQNIFPTADVHITGHTHRQAIVPEDFFVRDGDRVVRRTRHNISSGSFLGLEKYAQKAGYAPTRIGAPRVRLDGRVHDVKGSA